MDWWGTEGIYFITNVELELKQHVVRIFSWALISLVYTSYFFLPALHMAIQYIIPSIVYVSYYSFIAVQFLIHLCNSTFKKTIHFYNIIFLKKKPYNIIVKSRNIFNALLCFTDVTIYVVLWSGRTS